MYLIIIEIFVLDKNKSEIYCILKRPREMISGLDEYMPVIEIGIVANVLIQNLERSLNLAWVKMELMGICWRCKMNSYFERQLDFKWELLWRKNIKKHIKNQR